MSDFILTGNVNNRDAIEKALKEQLDTEALIDFYGKPYKDSNIYVIYNGEKKDMDVCIGDTIFKRRKIGSMRTIENQLRNTICECPSILALKGKIYELAKEFLPEDEFKEEYDKSKTKLKNEGHINRHETFKIAKFEDPEFYEYMLKAGFPGMTKMLEMRILERETGKSLKFVKNYDDILFNSIKDGINTEVYSSRRFKDTFFVLFEQWYNQEKMMSNLLNIIEENFNYEVSKPYTYRVTTKKYEVLDFINCEQIANIIEIQNTFGKNERYRDARRCMAEFIDDEYEKKESIFMNDYFNVSDLLFSEILGKKR